jgi:hypothetical protein
LPIDIKLFVEQRSIPLDAGFGVERKDFFGHENTPPEMPVVKFPEPVTAIPEA